MAVLISLKPKWAKLILSGEKTIEVRRTVPRFEGVPFKIFLYETKSENGRGAVVGEATCYLAFNR